MARTIIIPITDADTACSLGYLVRYKPSADMNWTTMEGLQIAVPEIITPSPLVVEYQIRIVGVSNSTQYDVEVTRQCCDGTYALPTTETYTTGS